MLPHSIQDVYLVLFLVVKTAKMCLEALMRATQWKSGSSRGC